MITVLHFLLSLPVKEFRKLINIWQSYGRAREECQFLSTHHVFSLVTGLAFQSAVQSIRVYDTWYIDVSRWLAVWIPQFVKTRLSKLLVTRCWVVNIITVIISPFKVNQSMNDVAYVIDWIICSFFYNRLCVQQVSTRKKMFLTSILICYSAAALQPSLKSCRIP